MANNTDPDPIWWGQFKFNKGQSKQWFIGPLHLAVTYNGLEWLVAHEQNETYEYKYASELTESNDTTGLFDKYSRFVFSNNTGYLKISPCLADRPVIARPLTPINLSAGESVTLYVSSPLWCELSVETDTMKSLEEIAIQRLSDTWFGPSTREGQLCYASSTHCRMKVQDLPHRPHRATTPVYIHNEADTPLKLERLNLPTPFLSLYLADNGHLWTPGVTLIREKDGDMAELHINSEIANTLHPSNQKFAPRISQDDSILFRAFNAVFN